MQWCYFLRDGCITRVQMLPSGLPDAGSAAARSGSSRRISAARRCAAWRRLLSSKARAVVSQ